MKCLSQFFLQELGLPRSALPYALMHSCGLLFTIITSSDIFMKRNRHTSFFFYFTSRLLRTYRCMLKDVRETFLMIELSGAETMALRNIDPRMSCRPRVTHGVIDDNSKTPIALHVIHRTPVSHCRILYYLSLQRATLPAVLYVFALQRENKNFYEIIK